MGTFLFRWPHAASDVYVTGTFDDWGKTERLNKVGNVFEKEVQLSNADEKIYYKFVVDDTWTTDHDAAQEDDGHYNVNNVLYPKHIKRNQAGSGRGNSAPATTGAAGAGAVGGLAAFPSAAAYTAQRSTSPPGAFPETPADEVESYGVQPLAATSGIGNPVSVPAGEKLPDHQTLTPHTVQSTATTSKEDYEKDASAALPAAAGLGAAGTLGIATHSALAKPQQKEKLIPESSLPMDAAATDSRDTGPHISSAAPTSTTAQLAGGVPLEKKRQAMVIDPTDAPGAAASETAPSVPEVVRESLSEAHQDPEAARFPDAVQEKSALERELLSKTTTSEATGEPAKAAAAQTSYYGLSTAVPATVEQSMSQAQAAPEAASEASVVAEKQQVENELLAKVRSTDATGEPAPVLAAATSETAPTSTGVPGQSAADTATARDDHKTDRTLTPGGQPGAAAQGSGAGELAAGGLAAGAAAGTAGFMSRHTGAHEQPAESTANRDVKSENTSATPATHKIPGQSSVASAAVLDGADETAPSAVATQRNDVPLEKSEGDRTEYAPVKSESTAPGASSGAAAAVSDGAEDPSLADEPAVQAMDRSLPAETTPTHTSTGTTTGQTSAYNSVTAPATGHGPTTTGLTAPRDDASPQQPSVTGTVGDARADAYDRLTSSENAPSTDVAGAGKSDAVPFTATPSDVKSTGAATDHGESMGATKETLGPAAAGTGTTTTTTSATTTPTSTKKTLGNDGSAASTPSSSAPKDKKKKNRISGFFKKIFDMD